MKSSPLLRLAAPLALATLLTGCPVGGELEEAGCFVTGCDTDGSASQYCDATPLFIAKCDGKYCHGGDEEMPIPRGGVELITPPAGMTLGQSLYNVEGSYPGAVTASCPPSPRALLIDPASPSESLLLQKVNGSFACGTAMPPPPTTLTALEMDCLVDWVNGVAATGGD